MTEPTMMLPCPFCASDARIQDTDDGGWEVVCIYCGATLFDGRADVAIERWNRRTAPPSPQPAPETGALDTMTADEWKAIARAWELQCHEAEANAAKVRDEALEDAAVECDNQSCLTRIATSPYAYAVNMARKCAGAIRALKSTPKSRERT